MISRSGSEFKAILSPCIGVCVLDSKGYCEGCHRNTDEIARWSTMHNDERLCIMEEILPERARGRGEQ